MISILVVLILLMLLLIVSITSAIARSRNKRSKYTNNAPKVEEEPDMDIEYHKVTVTLIGDKVIEITDITDTSYDDTSYHISTKYREYYFPIDKIMHIILES